MAIKIVVNKPKTQTVKKFPEFDSSKIYVYETLGKPETLRQITRNFNHSFEIRELNSSKLVSEFEGFLNVLTCVATPIYILDNQQDLARFIMGCREFPKVEEIKTEEELVWHPDEVSINDIDKYKIYASYIDGEINILTKEQNLSYIFKELSHNRGNIRSGQGCMKDIKKFIEIFLDENIYQFDTQEEFLRWSLEQVTGKKFINKTLYEALGDGEVCPVKQLDVEILE